MVQGPSGAETLAIWNPTAARGRHDALVRAVIERHGWGWVGTDQRGHATEIARWAQGRFGRVVAIGGDGTLSEVANGLVGGGAMMGIVPAGTANDYARSAGIPEDLAAAAALAAEGAGVAVDLAEVAGRGYSLNLAGLGFDAEVVRRYHRTGWFLNALGTKARYYGAIFQTFAAFQGVRAVIEVDGERIEESRLMLLAFGAARQYGEGMQILPEARLADGVLDVVWATELSAKELMGLLPKIYEAGHVGHPKVRFRQFRELRVTTEPGTALHIEGDLAGETPVDVRILAGGLRVVCGEGAAF